MPWGQGGLLPPLPPSASRLHPLSRCRLSDGVLLGPAIGQGLTFDLSVPWSSTPGISTDDLFLRGVLGSVLPAPHLLRFAQQPVSELAIEYTWDVRLT